MSILVHAAILSIAMAAPALNQNVAAQPTAAAKTPTPIADAKPWIDLSLTGEALGAAMTKAHVTAMGQDEDRRVFYIVRTSQGAVVHNGMSSDAGSALYLSGPAALQLGNPKGIKVYSVKATQQAICLTSSEYQDCVIGLAPILAANSTGR